MKVRQFRCPINTCNMVTSFDLLEVSRSNVRYLICDGCKRRWDLTLISNCCNISIKFIHQEVGKKPLTVVRSYSK